MTTTTEGQDWTRGDWLQTYQGHRFYPLSPRAEDIDPIDIAHALSLLCRYGGHVERFYSVAEHCVALSHAVERKDALAALLHDATEAYVADVVRPLKRYLPDYQQIEAAVWRAICGRFDLDLTLPPAVKDADTRILLDERNVLMPNTRYSWEQENLQPLGVPIRAWGPRKAEKHYALRLAELTR